MIKLTENQEMIARRNELLKKLLDKNISHDERLSVIGDVAHLDAMIASNIKSRLHDVYDKLEKCEQDVKKLTTGDVKRSYNALYNDCKLGYREAMRIAKEFSDLKKAMREHKQRLS